ncbi:nucleotide-diphospho-sugar transferases superfamily protein [Actinidia rufa]|uniref:ceramide glucosyltransferase n=1 Tax=Actinidia rufa TaxID=165716 RepID=A0A7J0DTT4_9ERIC|nr:nucleotide-diphospho-sugar transferases superfamily protein [Actinidia rufa]
METMSPFDSLDAVIISASRAFCSPLAIFIQMQITSLYGGPLEFLFVVESTEDPAYHAVNRLLADYKIGVDRMHKDTKYVLFLDDDVRLHPGSIGALTAEMEKNPDMIFRNDRHGVVSELQNGGYSDDMTLAAIAGAHKRLITSPPVAVFPHPLASDLSFSRYWNYLRKQTFVLESYTTKVNWIMNRALFSSHCYLSWGFVAPYLMAVVHVAAALRVRSKGYSLDDTAFTSCGLLLASCLAMCTFIELLSMWNLTRIEVRLCNLLSPEAPPLSLATYNWCLVFIAMLVDNFLYPISAFRSHFSQSINWSGIRYHLKDGKINKIDRSKGKGPKFTDLGGKHLYGKKGAPQRASILGALSRSLAHWRQPKKFEA